MKYNNNIKKITKKDLNKVLIRINFLQASWNFERMQALGFCYAISPILNKLYYDNEKKKNEAYKRHLEFFNTHPYMAAPIMGIVIAMEEKKANNIKIKSKSIKNLKISLMGPLAGVGDPVYWSTIRPLLSVISAGLAAQGQLMGPILFITSFNIIRISTLYYGLHYGYHKGIDIIQDLNKNFIQKITESASITGLFVIGVLVNKLNNIKTPITLSKHINNNPGIYLQNILDNLMPGIIPLSLTFFCLWLLNKKINSLNIIFILLIISIISNYFKILSL